jgi:probable rRNA maturation factor
VDPGSSSRLRAAASLVVSVTDGRGRAVKDGGLGRWLVRIAPASARGEVAIALVTDSRMRVLNRTYRNRDYATDVLSFQGDHHQGFGTQAGSLGDLVIAAGVAARQAREAGHSLQQELRVLALHGLLHLLGYDHDDPDDAGAMARVETRLRRKGGLKAGLIARSQPDA